MTDKGFMDIFEDLMMSNEVAKVVAKVGTEVVAKETNALAELGFSDDENSMDDSFGISNYSVGGVLCDSPNNKTYLADWDTPVVANCTTNSYWEELLDADFYSEEEYEALVTHEYYCSKRHAVKRVNISNAVEALVFRAKEELAISGCSDAEYHFTSGRKSFRYDVSSDYKANRKARSLDYMVIGIEEVRDAFIDHMDIDEKACYIHDSWEADDVVVTKFTSNPNNYVLASGDKDVLKACEGRHRRLYRKKEYVNSKGVLIPEVKDSWVITDAQTARLFPYAQCIAGDSGDNILGLYGISVDKAMKLLVKLEKDSECKLDDDALFSYCVYMYTTKGIGKEENNVVDSVTKGRPNGKTKIISKREAYNRALKNMRLVSMTQLEKVMEEVKGNHKVGYRVNLYYNKTVDMEIN